MPYANNLFFLQKNYQERTCRGVLTYSHIPMKYKHKSAKKLLVEQKTSTIKKNTAFNAKIMLENEDTRREVNKVWRAQMGK